jgi:transmembrane sensor
MTPNLPELEQEASHWLVLKQRGLTAAEDSAFARWLEADPQHAAIFREVEQTWNALDHLQDSRLAGEFEAELDELPDAAPRFHAWRRALVAATCIVAVGGVAYFGWVRPAQRNASYAETAVTEVGQTRLMELPDGSHIRLNTDSAVDVTYSKDERHITLRRGEALFTVAKNRQRPFVVLAEGVDVRAVGTAFNVRLRSEAVEVLVTEGKVSVAQELAASANASISISRYSAAVENGAGLSFVSAGERLTVPTKVAAGDGASTQPAPLVLTSVVVPSSEVDRVLAWRDQRLVFDGTPLADIVAEFNRYNRRKLVLTDRELGKRRFAGTFQASEPQTFVSLLQASYHLTVQESGDETRLSLPSN